MQLPSTVDTLEISLMETKGLAPLRLISKKFIPKAKQESKNVNIKPVSQVWLRRTVNSKGRVLPIYRPLVSELNRLASKVDILKEFRSALRLGDTQLAKKIWSSIWSTTEPECHSTKPSSGRSNPDATQLDWKGLAFKFGSYGPKIFNNALNDIARHNTRSPELVKQLVSSSNGALDPYIIGALMSKLANRNFELALELLKECQNNEQSLAVGCDALLSGIKMNPHLVVRIFSTLSLPSWYRIPDYLVGLVSTNATNAEFVPLLLLLAPFMAPTTRFDLLLRRVWTNSDLGAKAVRSLAQTQQLPLTFYPFIVRRLCEKVQECDLEAMKELDHLFDGNIAALAENSPDLVLHLVVQRLIATEGVQATSPVLDRWEESDAKGISEHTWILLFQSFRRMGRPDKCLEVLSRIMKKSPKLSLPMVGEYLHFTAKYYHLSIYISALQRVIPEITSTLEQLGILKYSEQLPHSTESALYPLNPQLTADNRDFYAHRVHESWLVITYQAVLATVETVDEALWFFGKFAEYAIYSNAAISLKIVDQFVILLTQHIGNNPGALDAAETIFRRALTDIKLKRANDGKNCAKSLQILCYKLVKSGELERAIRLLLDASQNPNVVVYGSSLQPWVHLVPEDLRAKLVVWAEKIGADIESNSIKSPSQVNAVSEH